MNAIDILFETAPYGWDQKTKEDYYLRELKERTEFHRARSASYTHITDALGWDQAHVGSIADIPFFPVRLFKDFELRSVEESEVFKTMTSSGTTGQRVSRIFLDRANSLRQTKVLAKICSDFLGSKRLPMLILDSRAAVKDRTLFSARGAGILGFSMLGRQPFYALDDDMQLDVDGILSYLERQQGQGETDLFLFGFTSIIWEHFYKKLKEIGTRLPLERGILIHGGGWKKLQAESVSNDCFKESLADVCGIRRVYNYYGMVEQTGSIFMECEVGHLHASIFSDPIIRRPADFSPAASEERGLVQLVSLLPTSYPGHSILTEDEGAIVGIDDCPCGRLGKRFKIYGRIQNAEIRGCSDTFQR
jgi:phenylacetate-coenzyme A ligase PaaK-like adenylate-forming protein